MERIKIFDAEYKFMNIIWEHSPISSTELVKLANQELGWKKSTTYTVIRRLCERGVIKNENSIVYALINHEQVMHAETEEHLGKVYDGSLKLFFTAFLQKEKLSKDEVEELKKIIEQYGDKEE
ncbi:BlaI/MecI/CopY family transcriptional regulator [Pseudobacteroides cellulosolvens]|uniref:Transcriptional repressor, CopY family n=1 Tax=Pseudobacteroides cellulosolvens ATCC 35603 = DSM 2933 TaxID=398512 RepID=A0A0L6JV54_9FIRM|nr:BlaI/MecI/CopY family transcriptional regulator [Pseudobacteroides cellulosolvens]KNY29614.1 transcriptional repressor, CopY family [Pseudobacteroides cellulosolvens ATCC 35603 = DSM 2933]